MPQSSDARSDPEALARRRKLGRLIREARGERSQTNLADEIGCLQASLSTWEAGQVSLTLEHVLRIERALGVPLGSLSSAAGYVSGPPTIVGPEQVFSVEAATAKLTAAAELSLEARAWGERINGEDMAWWVEVHAKG